MCTQEWTRHDEDDLRSAVPLLQGLKSTVRALTLTHDPLLTLREYRPMQASDGHRTDSETPDAELFNTTTLQRLLLLGSVLQDESVPFCSHAPGPDRNTQTLLSSCAAGPDSVRFDHQSTVISTRLLSMIKIIKYYTHLIQLFSM